MNNNGSKKIINTMSFVSLVLLGVALLLNFIFRQTGGTLVQLGSILSTVANAVAYTICAVYAFYFVRGKKVAYIITYIVAVVLVAVFLILPLFI